MIKATFDSQAAKAKLDRIRLAVSPDKLDPLVEKVALEALRDAIEATPKKWFGQVRRSWRILKPEEGQRIIRNDNKVMLFIDQGTKDHGPTSKKALYIPLTRAASAGWRQGMVYGRDYVLAKRVKGIKAMHIVAAQAAKAQDRLSREFTDYLKRAANG
jgi:hypothetical protein